MDKPRKDCRKRCDGCRELMHTVALPPVRLVGSLEGFRLCAGCYPTWQKIERKHGSVDPAVWREAYNRTVMDPRAIRFGRGDVLAVWRDTWGAPPTAATDDDTFRAMWWEVRILEFYSDVVAERAGTGELPK